MKKKPDKNIKSFSAKVERAMQAQALRDCKRDPDKVVLIAAVEHPDGGMTVKRQDVT